MKTLLVGLGNPILGDDGVGWKVVEAVERHYLSFTCDSSPRDGKVSHIETDYASLGGLSLMERLLGYEWVVLVDSMETGRSPVGSVMVFPLASLPNPASGHSASAHDVSLSTALRTAEQLGANIPGRVDVIAIEAKNVYAFSEELSQPVAAAVPIAVEKIIELLEKAT